ncbi:DKNYY domain-containing protein [Venatoribacter cucullus]|uniref:DKNYY domain-containing protein n=1 Tax=Venatoribacter cucullus TaxID=2661630 RepID=UPI00223EB562|nr:DKNYY domain-containing protein [Venatoribacter cucullus]UZK02527.1 hypothetical protein GAY96_00770 [Venatoribacter cucullus]
MLLIAQIITTFLLLFWPLLFMLSPMAFDAPGSENNRSYIIGMMLFLCYPIPLCAAYWIMDGELWGISGRTLTLITSVVIILALTLFGYGSLLKNALSGIASSGYSVADDQVFYNATPIAQADASSFTVLAPQHLRGGYAKDQHRVYYRGQVVTHADAQSFRPFDDGQEYWADQHAVYLEGQAITGASPAGFSRLPDAWHNATDFAVQQDAGQSTLYYRATPIGPVDAAQVVVLWPHIARDNQRIYSEANVILPMADAATFELLPESNEYGRDQQAVYDLLGDRSGVIHGADPASIEVLARGYLKDQHLVYHRQGYEPTQVLEGADSASFEVTGWDETTNADARDAHSLYRNGQRVAARPAAAE